MYTQSRSVINTVPMFRYAVLFAVGIVAGELLRPLWGIREWTLLLSALIIVSCVLQMVCGKLRAAVLLSDTLLLCGVAATGGIRVGFAERAMAVVDEETKVETAMIIAEEPAEHGRVVMFEAVAYGGEVAGLRGRTVQVSLLRDTIERRHERLHVGSTLRATARLSPLGGEWGGESYARWQRSRGIACRAFVLPGDWRPTSARPDIGLWQRVGITAAAWRERAVGTIRRAGLDGDNFAVTAAMALGYKRQLSGSLREEYSAAGAAHILAVSGMHIAILFMLIGTATRLRRRWVLVAVWGYAVLVGLPMSVVRAATMITLWEATSLLHRRQKPLNIFGATLFFMAVANPLSLYDIGFQMSFLAVLAIIVFVPALNCCMPRAWQEHRAQTVQFWSWKKKLGIRMLRLCYQTAAVSLAAQIGTAPLTAYYFGNVSLLGPLMSLIVIPAAFLIIPLALVAVGMSQLSLAGWLWLPLRLVATALNGIVATVAALPFASISPVLINARQVVAIYVIITMAALVVNRSALSDGKAPVPLT